MSGVSSVGGSSVLSVALQGLSRSEGQVNAAAEQIAQWPQDSVDLSSSFVSLMQARNSFDANTKVIHVADDMQKSLLDAIG